MTTTPLAAPLQADVAGSCPTRAQWDRVRPVEPAPTTEFQRLLMRRGVDHELAVAEGLLAAHPGAVDAAADDGDRLDREVRTVAAMAAGAPLILRTRLPLDAAGRRTGEADVLVRAGEAPVDGRWRYVPVEVKLHRLLDRTAVTDAAGVQRLGDLRVPSPEGCAPVGEGTGGAGIADDLLQLAHYHRMLEAVGRDWRPDADGAVIAGVIGGEGLVAWYRLDVGRLSVAEDVDPDRRESVLERYDREFAHRLVVVDTASRHLADPSVPLLEDPVRVGECDVCRWRDHCAALREAAGDVSVLPRATRTGAWPALRAAGLATLPALAAHDPARGVAGLRDAAVAGLVDEARARVATAFAHRRRGVDRVAVPRGDVEIDLDMENPGATDGCDAYLWGALVTDRTGRGLVPEGYRPAVSWDPDAGVAAAAAFGDLWTWFDGVRAACAAAGATLRVYCWHQQAEVGCLRDGARRLLAAGGADRRTEVEALVASDVWVDLKLVWQRQVVTGHGAGLKTVAAGLGFAWRDEDPGGAQSVVWWSRAVDATLGEVDRQAWRDRILAYNHDDVRATRHVREWLEREGPALRPAPVPGT